jgi:DNA mismatch endonuclease (patch repair protein)
VHGCFWHLHRCRRGQRVPVTNQGYWVRKRERNATRDRQHIEVLRKSGWKVLVIWECWIQDCLSLGKKLQAFLQ